MLRFALVMATLAGSAGGYIGWIASHRFLELMHQIPVN